MNQSPKSSPSSPMLAQKQSEVDYTLSHCISNRYNILSEAETKCFMALFAKNQSLLRVV